MPGPSTLGPYVRHLRLPFQLSLAPLFLWGAWLADGTATVATLGGFAALHLFLYPAATAFNSVYDRDEGPVGGMLAPPPVPPRLAALAAALALAGLALAAAVGPGFFLLYGLIALIAFAYSHPSVRWKARPIASALAMAVGQGAFGFLAGGAAMADPTWSLSTVFTGAAAAALATLGLYPVTQIYQVEEDRARGDRTLAVVLGPGRALVLGALCLAAAGAVLAWLVGDRAGAGSAFAAAAGFALVAALQLRLARALASDRLDPRTSWRRAMRLNALAAAGSLAFLAWQAL
jgi:1,4-dihydroxy-2-naphthoate octaprenyltransferase